MKRYLTLLPEVVEQTVGLITDLTPFNCNKCPCRESFYCDKYSWLGCAKTIQHWLFDEVDSLSSAERKRKMSNKEWIDFLQEQFHVSRTSTRDMLHGMMHCKKEDNFKKQFSGKQI